MSAHTTPIETAKGTIAVREDGRPDAPALLLCQRFRGGTEDWDPRFIAALARKRRVIRFDMPGIGASPGERRIACREWRRSYPRCSMRWVWSASICLAGHLEAMSGRPRR